MTGQLFILNEIYLEKKIQSIVYIWNRTHCISELNFGFWI